MQWESASEFFAMGGYGLYVWGSYLVTGVVLALEVASLARRGRTKPGAGGRIAGEETRR
jgi:heme exporter protein D